MPNASAPNAPWVAVWLSPHTIDAGLRDSHLRADHVDDALVRGVHVEQFDTEVASVLVQRFELLLCDRVFDDDLGIAWRGRNVVVGDRDHKVGASDFAIGKPETLKRLWRCHLMYEVEVDVEERWLALFFLDHVFLPDLLKHRFWHRLGHSWNQFLRPLIRSRFEGTTRCLGLPR